MEENKFEKQVRQKMDELRIHPQDSVWNKIEIRIEKKKRSNRELFFFLLLFCAFLTAGYILWNSNRHTIKDINEPAKNNDKKSKSEEVVNGSAVKENKGAQSKSTLVPASVNPSKQVPGNTDVKENGHTNSMHASRPTRNPKIKSITNPGEEDGDVAFSKRGKISRNNSAKIKITTGAAEQEEQSANEQINAGPADSNYNKTDLSPKPILKDEPVLKDEVAKAKDTSARPQTPPVKKLHSKNNNKWEFGILFSGGVSSLRNNFMALPNAYSYAYFNDPGSISGPVAVALMSSTKAGFGFMAGLTAGKNITSKVKLVSGINFRSFNTTSKAGSRNNSTGTYNSQNMQHTYKNHYNFIELPVALRFQLGKSKRMPLYWDGGLVISELLESRALQFNQSSGYYYSRNSVFNKTQIGFNTALSVALFSKQKNPLLIGPYFYYSASGLANEGLYDKAHFMFTGIRTEIIFGK